MAKGRRLANKRRNRQLRSERWELVHSAGCTEQYCASKNVLNDPEWRLDPELLPERAISVPRSLRHILGRFIGGQLAPNTISQAQSSCDVSPVAVADSVASLVVVKP